jgi:hypothetical protein
MGIKKDNIEKPIIPTEVEPNDISHSQSIIDESSVSEGLHYIDESLTKNLNSTNDIKTKILQKKNLRIIVKFVFQTTIHYVIIPIVITIGMIVYSLIHFGYLTGVVNIYINDNLGDTITVFHSMVSPILIFLSRRFKWKYLEFWSVIYLGILLWYLINGELYYSPDGLIDPIFLFLFPIIYYELIYENSYFRSLIGLNSRFNLKKFLKDFFQKS